MYFINFKVCLLSEGNLKFINEGNDSLFTSDNVQVSIPVFIHVHVVVVITLLTDDRALY